MLWILHHEYLWKLETSLYRAVKVSRIFWRQTEESHLIEMMIESEDLSDTEAFHHHLAGTVRKRPLFILVESLKHFPGRTLDFFRNINNRQDACRSHQVDRAFERNCTRVANVEQQQGVTLIKDEICDIETRALLHKVRS